MKRKNRSEGLPDLSQLAAGAKLLNGGDPAASAPRLPSKIVSEVILNPIMTFTPTIDDIAPFLGIRLAAGDPPAILSLRERSSENVRHYTLNRETAAWLREQLDAYIAGPADEVIEPIS